MRRHHDITKQEKLTAMVLVPKDTQDQIALPRCERLQISREIRRYEEEAIVMFDTPQPCHDSCIIAQRWP